MATRPTTIGIVGRRIDNAHACVGAVNHDLPQIPPPNVDIYFYYLNMVASHRVVPIRATRRSACDQLQGRDKVPEGILNEWCCTPNYSIRRATIMFNHDPTIKYSLYGSAWSPDHALDRVGQKTWSGDHV